MSVCMLPEVGTPRGLSLRRPVAPCRARVLAARLIPSAHRKGQGQHGEPAAGEAAAEGAAAKWRQRTTAAAAAADEQSPAWVLPLFTEAKKINEISEQQKHLSKQVNEMSKRQQQANRLQEKTLQVVTNTFEASVRTQYPSISTPIVVRDVQQLACLLGLPTSASALQPAYEALAQVRRRLLACLSPRCCCHTALKLPACPPASLPLLPAARGAAPVPRTAAGPGTEVQGKYATAGACSVPLWGHGCPAKQHASVCLLRWLSRLGPLSCPVLSCPAEGQRGAVLGGGRKLARGRAGPAPHRT